MDDEAALEALAEATAAMAATVHDLDLAAPVPACPGWDAAKLVDHLGRVHLWAEHCARVGTEPDPYPHRDRRQPIEDWYAAAAEALVTTLAALPPDQPAWSFSAEPGTQRTGFWRRRQFHETTVHRVDALQALGRVPTSGMVSSVPPLSAEQAADGVHEVLAILVPRTLVRRADEAPARVVPAELPVALRCDDVARAFTVRLREGRAEVADGAAADSVACVRGPATHLYLSLWGRADGSLLTVEGDQEAGRALLKASLVP